MQDWELLAKNFTNINDAYINNEELARLELYILNISYLEEGLSYFTEVSIEDNNEDEKDAKELEPVSDSKEEKKKIYGKSRRILGLLSILSLLVHPPVITIGLSLCLLYLY